jgi:hypothetical protein
MLAAIKKEVVEILKGSNHDFAHPVHYLKAKYLSFTSGNFSAALMNNSVLNTKGYPVVDFTFSYNLLQVGFNSSY